MQMLVGVEYAPKIVTVRGQEGDKQDGIRSILPKKVTGV